MTKVYQILFVIFAVFIGTGATAYEELRVGQTVVRAEAHGAPINNLTWNLLSNTKKNPYLREGKEYIDMYGWDKYDFLNRTFDTWILRTLQPDPMADMYYGISPYALWANNPMKYVDPDGRNPFDFMLLYFKLKNWAEEQMGAAQRLVTGTSGSIDAPAEANIPQQVRDINTTVGTMQDVSSVVEGAVSVAEGVGSIPGMDMVLDPVMGLTHAMNGDVENAVPYALATVIPGAVSGGMVKGGVKVGSRIFEVGSYNTLRGVETGLEAHHVGQRALMKKFIPGYNSSTAPSILVPSVGHTQGTGVLSRTTSGVSNARQVLARDIFELRRVYPNIPNRSLQQLIQMNKTMYPGAFIK